jgi:hypothetical protein
MRWEVGDVDGGELDDDVVAHQLSLSQLLTKLCDKVFKPSRSIEAHPNMKNVCLRIVDAMTTAPSMTQWFHCPICKECGPYTKQCGMSSHCKKCDIGLREHTVSRFGHENDIDPFPNESYPYHLPKMN